MLNYLDTFYVDNGEIIFQDIIYHSEVSTCVERESSKSATPVDCSSN